MRGSLVFCKRQNLRWLVFAALPELLQVKLGRYDESSYPLELAQSKQILVITLARIDADSERRSITWQQLWQEQEGLLHLSKLQEVWRSCLATLTLVIIVLMNSVMSFPTALLE